MTAAERTAMVENVQPEWPYRRVLVVDDHPDTAEMIRRAVSMLGFECEAMSSGISAVRRTQSFRPELALVDIGLPDISGLEVARRIRASGHPVVLIAITGWDQPRDVARAYEAGFDRLVVKPFGMSALKQLFGSPMRRYPRMSTPV